MCSACGGDYEMDETPEEFPLFTKEELERYGKAARNLRWLLDHPGEMLPEKAA